MSMHSYCYNMYDSQLEQLVYWFNQISGIWCIFLQAKEYDFRFYLLICHQICKFFYIGIHTELTWLNCEMQCSFDAVINWKAEAEYRQISIFNLTINSALYRAANTGRGSNPCGKFSFDNLIVLIGCSSLPRVYDKITQNVIACFGLDMKLKSELKLFVQWSSTNQS